MPLFGKNLDKDNVDDTVPEMAEFLQQDANLNVNGCPVQTTPLLGSTADIAPFMTLDDLDSANGSSPATAWSDARSPPDVDGGPSSVEPLMGGPSPGVDDGHLHDHQQYHQPMDHQPYLGAGNPNLLPQQNILLTASQNHFDKTNPFAGGGPSPESHGSLMDDCLLDPSDDLGDVTIEFGDPNSNHSKGVRRMSKKKSKQSQSNNANNLANLAAFDVELDGMNELNNADLSDQSKKRKLAGQLQRKPEPNTSPFSMGGGQPTPSIGGVAGMAVTSSHAFTHHQDDKHQPCFSWRENNSEPWQTVCDEFGRPLGHVNLSIEIDKGMTFSAADKAFVCQRKNHFQVTVAIHTPSQTVYLQRHGGYLQPLTDDLFVTIHGQRVENGKMVLIEQGKLDRSKSVMQPVPVDLAKSSKVTMVRLHFGETTANNMRKKGKPNPDQRYFSLIISVKAKVNEGDVTLCSYVSDKVIVRASNLSAVVETKDSAWTTAKTPNGISHYGPVGINTDQPSEALHVHGNAVITGTTFQPSDERVKENFALADTSANLNNVKRMTVYEYDLKEEWAAMNGRENSRHEMGVKAQELRGIIPDAVKDTGQKVTMASGDVDNLLVVNKERLFMENVGAVQELCKMTDNLENRIRELEALNQAVLKEAEQERNQRIAQSNEEHMAIRPVENKFPVMRTVAFIGMAMMCFSMIAMTVVLSQKDDSEGSSSSETMPQG